MNFICVCNNICACVCVYICESQCYLQCFFLSHSPPYFQLVSLNEPRAQWLAKLAGQLDMAIHLSLPWPWYLHACIPLHSAFMCVLDSKIRSLWLQLSRFTDCIIYASAFCHLISHSVFIVECDTEMTWKRVHFHKLENVVIFLSSLKIFSLYLAFIHFPPL